MGRRPNRTTVLAVLLMIAFFAIWGFLFLPYSFE